VASPVPRDAIRQWFQQPRGGRPDRVGAEFEMLPVDLRSNREAPYLGKRGVEAILKKLIESGNGWTGTEEAGRLIALARPDGATVTLEPGSQLEFSTEPRDNVMQIERELRAFVREFYEATAGMDIALLAVGLNPFSSTAEVQLGPKARYKIMTEYLSKTGDLALDMMRRTLSVHCSFDFSDEKDAVEKTRLAFAVAPIVTAIFAHSPYEKLEPNGFQSFRGEVWRRTDPDRTGIIPEVFDADFGFSKYVDLMMKLPLIFVLREKHYVAAHGLPAARWFAGDLPPELEEQLRGIKPEPADIAWVVHQSFRDARLRRYLECRAADFPSPDMATAPAALWTGILYDPAARAGIWNMLKDLDLTQRRQLSADVAKNGLRAKAAGREVLSIARDVLALAKAGVTKRGFGEEALLAPVEDLLAKGQSPSDRLLARWPKKADAAGLIEALRLRG
jgi:glutamate--cysteine ligase